LSSLLTISSCEIKSEKAEYFTRGYGSVHNSIVGMHWWIVYFFIFNLSNLSNFFRHQNHFTLFANFSNSVSLGRLRFEWRRIFSRLRFGYSDFIFSLFPGFIW
jgi:hypothetical protein